jgi:hypothetical protein
MVSVPTIGLDQFLRISPTSFPVQHWITDSLMTLPLFAAGCWAGDRVACRTGSGTENRSEIVKRPIVISLFCALLLAPAWFAINKTDNPVTAQPLVFPHASDSGDVYLVPPGVIVALVCVSLVPTAFWLGRAITRAACRTRAAGQVRLTAAPVRYLLASAAPLLLAAAVPLLAWLLYRTAGQAYASQVYCASSPPVAARHTAAVPAAARIAAAPFAVGYQIAHALQDGLAGQAAGLPAAALALLITARREARGQRPAIRPEGQALRRPLLDHRRGIRLMY